MPPTIPSELEIEMRYFNDHRAELMREAAGKFALVKGDVLLGTFDSETAAIRHGYETLGNVPFLVKQITEVDIPLNFALHLGV
jgi:gag-polyprotein putative aspartyl protease